MYILILSKGDGEYEDYRESPTAVWLHSQKQNSELLEKEYSHISKLIEGIVKEWLKLHNLKNTKVNRAKAYEAEEFKGLLELYPQSFDEFLLRKGFFKVDSFENIITW